MRHPNYETQVKKRGNETACLIPPFLTWVSYVGVGVGTKEKHEFKKKSFIFIAFNSIKLKVA